MPDSLLSGIAAVLAGYLIGCFNTGYYLVRWRTRSDLREHGSGTLGARNTGRLLGRSGFALALAGDMLKGTGAVLLAQALTDDPWFGWSAMLAVVLGHVYPIQLGFRGGKGIATSAGALLVLSPPALLVATVALGAGLLVSRRPPLASVLAALTLPIWPLWHGETAATVALVALATLLVVRHLRDRSADRSAAPVPAAEPSP